MHAKLSATKPVSLIVANAMHGVYQAKIELDDASKKAGITPMTSSDLATIAARKLLCSIAHEATASMVLTALRACGAPHTLSAIADGIQAVGDEQEHYAPEPRAEGA